MNYLTLQWTNVLCIDGLKNTRYIVSDCDAVQNMYEQQGYAKSPKDAVTYALKAGNGLILDMFWVSEDF